MFFKAETRSKPRAVAWNTLERLERQLFVDENGSPPNGPLKNSEPTARIADLPGDLAARVEPVRPELASSYLT